MPVNRNMVVEIRDKNKRRSCEQLCYDNTTDSIRQICLHNLGIDQKHKQHNWQSIRKRTLSRQRLTTVLSVAHRKQHSVSFLEHALQR